MFQIVYSGRRSLTVIRRSKGKAYLKMRVQTVVSLNGLSEGLYGKPKVMGPSKEFEGFLDGDLYAPGALVRNLMAVKRTKPPRVKGEGKKENVEKSQEIRESLYGLPIKSARTIRAEQIMLKKEQELSDKESVESKKETVTDSELIFFFDDTMTYRDVILTEEVVTADKLKVINKTVVSEKVVQCPKGGSKVGQPKKGTESVLQAARTAEVSKMKELIESILETNQKGEAKTDKVAKTVQFVESNNGKKDDENPIQKESTIKDVTNGKLEKKFTNGASKQFVHSPKGGSKVGQP